MYGRSRSKSVACTYHNILSIGRGNHIQRGLEFPYRSQYDGQLDLLNLVADQDGLTKTINRCLLIRVKLDERFICRFQQRMELCSQGIEVLQPVGFYVHGAP